MMQNWPGDQVRKVGNEQQIVDKPVLARPFGKGINQKRDLREGEERDSDGQDYLDYRQVLDSNRSQRIEQKICVLEPG